MIKLSIIIPTYNKPEILKMTLESLAKQTFPKSQFEVIVIDDGSPPEVRQKIKNFLSQTKLNLSFLVQNHQGPAAARNKGIRKAKGEIVLIINDDTIATLSLLKRHYDFHRKNPKENFGLLGYVTWHPNLEITPFMYWLEHGGPYFSFSQIKGKEVGWQRFWTCNISLKKNFLVKNGLFDEEFPYAAWEDVELGYRLGKTGLRLMYNKRAAGYHYHPTTVFSIKNKMRNNGESVLIFRKKVPFGFLPPLGKYPKLAVQLDQIFFCKPICFLIEKFALFCERRFRISWFFNLLLLHYRIEGVRSGLKEQESL